MSNRSLCFPHGPDVVRKVGLCTGAASDLLEEAARVGCDLYVTGELAERAAELAYELQITLSCRGALCHRGIWSAARRQ